MEKKMLKLLSNFQSAPTLENAQRVAAYSRKHPFATIILTGPYLELFGQAIDLIQASK
jgi:hypothetical protein